MDLKQQIADMWMAGASQNSIGAAFGKTRSAIGGIIGRMGLQRGKVRAEEIAVQEEIEEIANGKGVNFMDLQLHHCRWIIGKGDYGLSISCGKTRLNSTTSYCKEHHRMAKPR